MMFGNRFPATIILALLALATTGATALGQKPPNKPDRGIIHADYGPDPTSLEEMWRVSDLIVRGSVKTSSLQRSSASKRAVPTTRHHLQLLEILKDDTKSHKVNQAITLVQMAGSLDIDGMQVTVDPGRMPILAPKQEVLVFLRRVDGSQDFSLAYGPAGLYVLDDPTVTIPAEARPIRSLFQEKGAVPRNEFLTVVKQQAARRGGGQ
jgi:hypothetical protein